jgi:hypothetical protein
MREAIAASAGGLAWFGMFQICNKITVLYIQIRDNLPLLA